MSVVGYRLTFSESARSEKRETWTSALQIEAIHHRQSNDDDTGIKTVLSARVRFTGGELLSPAQTLKKGVAVADCTVWSPSVRVRVAPHHDRRGGVPYAGLSHAGAADRDGKRPGARHSRRRLGAIASVPSAGRNRSKPNGHCLSLTDPREKYKLAL